MFDANTYIQRRKKLREQMGSGLALLLGNDECPMNYPANPYHFRQDSSFLYFFGLDHPGLAGIVDVDEGKDIIFGDDVTIEDIIWMGFQPLLKDRASKCGVTETMSSNKLGEVLKKTIRKGRKVHFLPPYRSEAMLKISDVLGIKPALVIDYSSTDFIKAVVAQRSIKSDEEIEEMERALAVTHEMYLAAMGMAESGTFEREIVGRMEGIARSAGCYMAFPTILSIDGQILHNHYHGNRLEKGRLVVCDSGAESQMHYASDITRTFAVDGVFTQKQKEVYEVVLKTQKTAILEIKPGVTYKEVHMSAAKTTASGLKDLGLMKGDVDEAVQKGAHALFFPHGLGHQIGLDVHDMEDLGEKFVGYDENIERSDQFGLAYLRYGKELNPGLVLTVEPGIYFIPALIDKWRSEGKFADFLDYDRIEGYKDFGGVRIEDDVLVTVDGSRVLGKPIPKTLEQLRSAAGKG
ncbi:MAG: aminopeptidase P family protein [Candidatus Aminicenantes bacterium]|nr:aminopeptidase P family protein [Candidatus Aminicenantes bacterium]